MRKILVSQRIIENENYYEIRDTLDVKWGELARVLKFLPIILPSSYDPIEYFKTFNIDGILLTGGNNLGAISSQAIDIKRDEFEKRLIQYGIEKNIPILGTCRGMQILLEYFGYPLTSVKNHIATEHSIKVCEESKYYDILKNQLKVNSFHGYGLKHSEFINRNNDKLNQSRVIVTALAEDGVVEAIEHLDYKIYGQMWHPERQEPFQIIDLQLFKKHFEL